MTLPQETELVARVRLAEQRRALAEIDATGWRMGGVVARGGWFAGARQRSGRLLIRAGVWLAGLPVESILPQQPARPAPLHPS